MAMLQRERNGALFGVHGVTTLKKYLTTPALLETPVCDSLPGVQCLASGKRVAYALPFSSHQLSDRDSRDRCGVCSKLQCARSGFVGFDEGERAGRLATTEGNLSRYCWL